MNTIQNDIVNIIDQASLFFCEGNSDKEYHLQLVQASNGYFVNFQYGRRGSALKDGSKTSAPVTLEVAQKAYNKVLNEKLGKGYQAAEAVTATPYVSAPAVAAAPKQVHFIPQLLNSIAEEDVERYLQDDSWGAQPKMDGRHQCILREQGHKGKITVTNRKGQAIGYPATLETALLTTMNLLMDAEAIGESFHVFDLLEANDEDLRGFGYRHRYEALKDLFDYFPASEVFKKTLKLVPLAIGYKAKKALLDKLRAEDKEGIVFKRLDAPHIAGKAHSDMWKFKFLADASCRVREGRPGKRSVGLELLDDSGKWIPVGNVTIGSSKIPLPRVGQIINVIYLYAHKGGSLYQPIFDGVRDDIHEGECTVAQLKYKAEED